MSTRSSGIPQPVALTVIHAFPNRAARVNTEFASLLRRLVEAVDARTPHGIEMRVPIAVSARHAHLSSATVHKLFGEGYELRVHKWLSQTGQFSAEETVSLIGPRGRLDHVRLMGPPRERDQVELSCSDERLLGVVAPLRVSGDLTETPGLQIVGPAGSATLQSGVITARRHIHMSPTEAQQFGLQDGQVVSVTIDSNGRDLMFRDIVVRVAPAFRLELHLDTDEANAAGVSDGDYAEIVTNDTREFR